MAAAADSITDPTTFIRRFTDLIEELQMSIDYEPRSSLSFTNWSKYLDESIKHKNDALPQYSSFDNMAALNQSHQHFLLYWNKLKGLSKAWQSSVNDNYDMNMDKENWAADRAELIVIISEIGKARAPEHCDGYDRGKALEHL